MELIEYQSHHEFLQDIYPFIEENFISHYLLFEPIERLIQREEQIYYGCTVKNKLVIEIIYLHTNRGHYFYGITKNKLAVHQLSEALSIERFDKDSILYGSTFIIDNFNNEKRLDFRNIRHRYYMSLKTYSPDNVNFEGKLHNANEQDYVYLAPLNLEFYKEEFEGKGILTEEEICSEFKTGLQNDGIYYWKVKNQITTLVSTLKLPGERIYIPNIYTIPEFRKKGISKSALVTILTKLFDSGNMEVGLNVKVANQNAIGLFSSVGMNIIYETGIYEAKNITAANSKS